eukprot:CAMPEP_0196823986 /NCGR_PEP_ID=MMETSP1362-20130617/89942_1 /TAXON_ID=163516 /ORGANISM="Leptocylindrus danicus, Strain CCMP1856" /LENGTH=118 /DNA_ID=CAMNT_0042204071 /DNA_START=253 /DNA_END=609 /DNA_ORIENTATION=+
MHVKGERLHHKVTLLADIHQQKKVTENESIATQEDNVAEQSRFEQYQIAKRAEREERLYSEARSEFMKLFPQDTPGDCASKESKAKRQGMRGPSLFCKMIKMMKIFDKPLRKLRNRKG